MNKPNTFIIGAPKCGTTAMAHYLSFHPQIFMSHIKEPHFFIRDDMPKMCSFNEEEYLSLFDEANEGHKVVMEASVWYLYGQSSVEKINEYNPESKLIIMLRRPDEMVYAMHNQNYITRNDDISDFKQAWSLNNERRSGNRLPKHCKDSKLLEYDKIANYYTQIARVYKSFSKEDVLIIMYEDFKSSPQNCYKKIQEFLDLEQFMLDEFEIINENKAIKSEIAANLINRPPKFMIELAKIFRKTFGIKKIGIRDYFKSLNQRAQKRLPLSNELKIEVANSYKTEIQELEKLLKLNLSHWYEGES